MEQLKTSFWASLAVARYDLKTTFGSFNSVFSLIFSSCMGLIIISLVLSGAGKSGDSRLLYLFPGLVSVLCLSGLVTVSGKIQNDSTNGTVSLILLSPTPAQALLIGHLIGLIAQIFMQAASLLLITMLLVNGLSYSSFDALAGAIGAMVLGAIFFGSLGAVLAVGNPLQGMSQVIVMIVMSFSVIASTAYFSLEHVPGPLLGIAKINPISFICEAMRFAFCVECQEVSWTPLFVVLVQAILAFALACIALKRLDRWADK